MRVCICCCVALLMMAPPSLLAQQAAAKAGDAVPPASPLPTTPPVSDEDKANQLSEQVGKLMVKCVNLLTAQDPLSLDYCKQQRDLADQYPPHMRLVDKMMAHDEYGIALAAFDHKQEALEEFDREVTLVPKGHCRRRDRHLPPRRAPLDTRCRCQSHRTRQQGGDAVGLGTQSKQSMHEDSE